MLQTRALTLATAVGTVLQVLMVVAGHTNPSIAAMFAVGGMGISFLAGILYANRSGAGTMSSMTVGGAVAGAVCAFLGILVSRLLGDVPTSLLLLGTVSSAVTGAIGGMLGAKLGAPRAAASVQDR